LYLQIQGKSRTGKSESKEAIAPSSASSKAVVAPSASMPAMTEEEDEEED
jgi:hypothetical protein